MSAATKLSWDEGSWSRWSGEPALYGKNWNKLSGEEKSAAHSICHFNVTWPGDGPTINLINQYDGDSSGANRLVASVLLPSVMAIVATAVFV